MKSTLGFLVLAALAGALIGVTRWLTVDDIAANQIAREKAAIQNLLGNTANTDPYALDRLCRTTVRGYAGNIDLLVLPDATAPTEITAVRVLQHRETPGIGDFITIDNSSWVLGFAGLALQQTPRDTVKRWNNQLDAVSGATITRKAMIKGVANACERVD